MAEKERVSKFREQLAENFASLLERETGTWQKTWLGKAQQALPYNYVRGNQYSGANLFNLMIAMLVDGKTDPRFVTRGEIFAQDVITDVVKGKGGVPKLDEGGNPRTYTYKERRHPDWKIKAGSHAYYVEQPLYYDKKEKKSVTPEKYREILQKIKRGELEEERAYDFKFYLKSWPVFNAEDIDGIEPYMAPEPKKHDNRADNLISDLASAMKVGLVNNEGDECSYNPRKDLVTMPFPEYFISGQAYDFSALHELTHATGHEKRLNRNQTGRYGSELYAKEELVAEIGSCLMAAQLGVSDVDPKEIKNSEAYVKGWIESIRDKPEALADAIREAMKATHYMDEALEKYREINKDVDKVPAEADIELVGAWEWVTGETSPFTEWSDEFSSYRVKEGVSFDDFIQRRESIYEKFYMQEEYWHDLYDKEYRLAGAVELKAFVDARVNPARMYAVYQLSEEKEMSGSENSHLAKFESFDSLQKHGLYLDPECYVKVFEEPYYEGMTLDDIYMRLNRDDRPNAQGMTSLSVSDLVVVDSQSVLNRIAYYVDSYGFEELDLNQTLSMFSRFDFKDEKDNTLFLSTKERFFAFKEENSSCTVWIGDDHFKTQLEYDVADEPLAQVVKNTLKEHANGVPVRISEKSFRFDQDLEMNTRLKETERTN